MFHGQTDLFGSDSVGRHGGPAQVGAGPRYCHLRTSISLPPAGRADMDVVLHHFKPRQEKN